MTWAEFKKTLEEKGVTDSDRIWYIDIDDEWRKKPKVNRVKRSGHFYIECTNVYENKKSLLRKLVDSRFRGE